MPKSKKVRCPYCNELISKKDNNCPYCGEPLILYYEDIEDELKKTYLIRENENQQEEISPEKSEKPKVSNINNLTLKVTVFLGIFVLILVIIFRYQRALDIERKISISRQALNYGNLDRALFTVNSLLSEHPHNLEGQKMKEAIREKYIKRAKEKLSYGYYKDAINYYEKALQIKFSNSVFTILSTIKNKFAWIDNKVLLAQKAIDRNDYNEALKITDSILDKYPHNEKAEKLKDIIRKRFIWIGNRKFGNGYYKEAIFYYKKAQSIKFLKEDTKYIKQAEESLKIKKIEQLWAKNGVKKRFIALFSDKIKSEMYGIRFIADRLLGYADFNISKIRPSSNNSICEKYGCLGFYMNLERSLHGNNLYINKNKLIIETRKKGWSFWPKIKLPHRNFIVRFKLEYLSGEKDSGAGFWFRAFDDLSKRYEVIFNASYPYQYNVGYYDNNKNTWINIKDWTFYYDKPRTIELAVLYDYVQIYINGKYVTTVHGIANKEGTCLGFVVGTDHMKYAFDDFCILSIKGF